MNIDLFIENVQIYNSYTKKFAAGNVAIRNGKIAYVGESQPSAVQDPIKIDGRGRWMIPGFIDIHMHIESALLTPHVFAQALVSNGITTVVSDPHEIANVFGARGIREMIMAYKQCPVDIFAAIPSSVPSTELETTGGRIEIAEIESLMQEFGDHIICLGEVMNFQDIITNPEGRSHRLLRHFKDKYPHLPIEGHCPRVRGFELACLISAGIDSDHTEQSVEGMDERIRNGMFIEIQEKSMKPEVMNYLITHPVSEHFCFVTDDVMPDKLQQNGHLNHLVRKAVRMGMRVEDAIYAASFTPARRMKLLDRGVIAPGKVADFQLITNLETLDIDQVYVKGKLAFDREQGILDAGKAYKFPRDFYNSVQLSPLQADNFRIKAPVHEGVCPTRVIMVSANTTFTEEKVDNIPVKNGELRLEDTPYCYIGVFARYGDSSGRMLGVIGGDTIKQGAVATTYAHDHHNLLVIGKSAEDMQLAANEVIARQGGICTVIDGQVSAFLPLPIGGILSNDSLAITASHVQKIKESLENQGYRHNNILMSLSTITLPVSPELKMTDLGLVRVNEGEIVDLFVRT